MTPDSSRAARDLLARLVSREAWLGDAAVLVRQRHEEVSRIAARREHVIALLGDAPVRTAMLNQLVGEPLLDERRIDLTGTVVAFKRGVSADYRARLVGGAIEQYSHLPAAPDDPADTRLDEIEARLPAAREAVRLAEAAHVHEIEALSARLEVAEAELAHAHANALTRRDAVAQAGQSLPVFHRAPPPWWALWWWLPRLLLPFWRAARATYAQAARQLAAGESRIQTLEGQVVAARARLDERRQAVGGAARAALGALEVERERALAELEEVHARRHRRFVGALRQLTDLGARGPDVEELIVDVPGDAIPAGVVLLDVSFRGHSEDRERAVHRLIEDADGYIAAGPILQEIVRELESLHIVALPPGQELISYGVGTLRQERLRRIAARTGEAVAAARAHLAAAEERAKRVWRLRLDAAAALRIVDPPAMAAEQLARSTGHITERAHLAIEHATDQLLHELSLIEARWRDAILAAITMDELRQVVTRIDHEAVAALREVQHNVNLTLGGVVGGAVRDLAPDAIAPLLPRFRALGAPPPAPDSVDMAGLPVLASLARPGLGASLEAGWLASIFRPFEALRDEAGARLTDRLAKLRNACTAELLDSEPPITALLRGAMERLVNQATLRLAEVAEAKIAAEQAAVERERAELAPVAALREELESGGRATA